MNHISKILNWIKLFKGAGFGIILLMVLVPVIWVFTKSGDISNLMLANTAAIVVLIAAISLFYPLFGFYVCIVGSFFIFLLVRFLKIDAPLVSGIDIMVYITFISILIGKVIKKEPFLKNCNSPITFMMGIIIIYYLIEFFNPNSVSKDIYFLLFRRFVTVILFFYCAIQLFTTYDKVVQFFKILLLLTGFSAFYGVYQKWVGIPKFERDYFLADGAGALGMLDNGDFRIASFVSDCTAFGLLMSGSLIIVLAIILNKKLPFIRRVILFVSILLMALSMSYSGTRTATFMLVVEVCLYILMTSTQRKTILFSFVFASILGAVLFAPSYGNTTLNRLKSTFESEDESLKVRDVNRKYIQPYILAHPIGGGVGTTGVVYMKYNIGHPLAGFPTDSGLLAMVLEFGWIGLLVQGITYFVTLQQGIQGYYRSRKSKFKLIYLASTLFLFGYIAAQYSQIAIGQIPGGFLFYGLTAVIIRLRQMDKTD